MSRRLGIRIGFLIHDVSRLRRVLFDSRSTHLGITRSEAWVLTGISRRDSGISQTELAKVLGLGKVTTGEFVAILEKKGFAARSLDDIDRRAYRVRLTRSGRTVLAKISDIVALMNSEMFVDVTPPELGQFALTLANMKHRLVEMTEIAPSRRQVKSAGPKAPADPAVSLRRKISVR